ncbi:hypothetical protein NPIL_466151 [Nephila pilipes]|uniref:Cytochrome P450 n=1 Tax=Nephila pilipes TaxID=299642 RepID=A0A8X6MZC2_NEPPI|nr:hypothetical protein NPIL_466151 [Nephila pilipes]
MFDTVWNIRYEALIAVLAVFFIYLIRCLVRKAGSKIPPGPIGLPIVGYLPFLSKDVHLNLIELAKKYGDVFRA